MSSRERMTRIVDGRHDGKDFTVEARQEQGGEVHVESVQVDGESVSIGHLPPQSSMNAALDLGAHRAKAEIDEQREAVERRGQNTEERGPRQSQSGAA